MSGRNKEISVYAKELLDTSFLLTFFCYCVNNHFYHTGRLDQGAYDNIVAMLIVISVVSLIIRWTVVKVWGFRKLPLKQYIGLLEMMLGLGVIYGMYNMNLMGEELYRLISQSGYCIIMFCLTSAKIRNA